MTSATDDSTAAPEENDPGTVPTPLKGWRTETRPWMQEVRSSNKTRHFILSTIEIILIVAWTLFYARDYLDFSQNVSPWGREFGMAIQTNYIWSLLPFCGDCVFWNGSINGGSPAFAELHGAILHPLVVVSTLIWGGLNGAKAALIGAFAMAGIAQWWLARVMKLGLVARLWAGMMAVVGGHLAGKMEIGVFAVVISTAAAALVIAAGVNLALTGRRRSALLLGITLALAIVSGQGYMQIGLLLGVMPAFIVFFFDRDFHLRGIWREYALAAGIGLLLAGVFLVPMFHFWPNFAKDITTDFSGVQALGDSILNLVISDLNVYNKEVLGALPFPYLYITFIGWIPVLLAVLSLRLVPRRQSRLLLFFVIAIVLVYMLASAITLSWIGRISPEFAAAVRVPSLIAGLAVPLILGLAAWSVDLLLRKEWPITIFGPREASDNARPLSFSLSWIVVGILLLLSLRTAFTFSRDWLTTVEVDANSIQVVEAAESIVPAFTQWAELPVGEHYWAPIGLANGLKLTNVVRPWHWKDREFPNAQLKVTREQTDPDSAGYLGAIADMAILVNSDVHYAFVQTETDIIPCKALALGGHIDVTCSTNKPGKLIVQEHLWSGWKVERDGQPATMNPGPWLNAEAPAGTHQYHFRYRPWDVYLGLVFTIVGIALCIWIWFYHSETDPSSQEFFQEDSTEI